MQNNRFWVVNQNPQRASPNVGKVTHFPCTLPRCYSDAWMMCFGCADDWHKDEFALAFIRGNRGSTVGVFHD